LSNRVHPFIVALELSEPNLLECFGFFLARGDLLDSEDPLDAREHGKHEEY